MRKSIHIASLLRILDEAEKGLGEQDGIVRHDLEELRREVSRYASEPHGNYNVLVTTEF